MWITLVAAACWCAWHWSSHRRISSIAALGLAAVLGISIGAIQLLPSIEFFSQSVRAVWSRDEALSYSLSPVNLIQLWAPFAFQFRVFAPFEDQQPHEFIVYNGALCTMALAWIAIRWRALTHRRLAVALLVFAGLGLWLAFGRYGGLYPLIASLPVISGLRASSRHVVLFQFALAGIAAIAAEDLLGLLRRRERVETQTALAAGRACRAGDRHDSDRRNAGRVGVGRDAPGAVFDRSGARLQDRPGSSSSRSCLRSRLADACGRWRRCRSSAPLISRHGGTRTCIGGDRRAR